MNKKNKIVGIIIVSFIIISMSIYGFWFWNIRVKVDTKNISSTNIINKIIEDINKSVLENDKISISTTFKGGDFDMDMVISGRQSMKDKKFDFNIDIDTDLNFEKVSGSSIPEINISDLKFGIKGIFVNNRFYMSLVADEQELISVIKDKQISAFIQLFGSSYLNKYFVLDIEKIAKGIEFKPNDIFEEESIVKILEEIKKSDIFSIKRTGKTKKINENAVAEFRVIFNSGYIFNYLKSDLDFKEYDIEFISKLVEIISKSIYVWVSADNAIHGLTYDLSLGYSDFKEIKGDFTKDIFNDFEVNLEIDSDIKRIKEFKILIPKNAVDVSSLFILSSVVNFFQTKEKKEDKKL